MMKTTYMKYIEYAITAVVLLLYGCVSERDTVSVRQVVSERFIILRIKKDKTTVFSLSYPVTLCSRRTTEKTFIMQTTLIYFVTRNLVQVQQPATWYQMMKTIIWLHHTEHLMVLYYISLTKMISYKNVCQDTITEWSVKRKILCMFHWNISTTTLEI